MGGGQFNKPGTVKGGVHVYACRVAMVTHGELWAFIHSVHVTVTDSDCTYMSSVWEVYVYRGRTPRAQSGFAAGEMRGSERHPGSLGVCSS